jgi:hypothetical protein
MSERFEGAVSSSTVADAVYDFLRVMPWGIVTKVFHRLSKERGAIGLQHEGNGSHKIAVERRRQITEEGYDAAHDEGYAPAELTLAAICYAAPCPIFRCATAPGKGMNFYDPWPWDEDVDKREQHGTQRRLVIAGALIAAEIDRMGRCNE